MVKKSIEIMNAYSGLVLMIIFALVGCKNDSGLDTFAKHIEFHYQCRDNSEPLVVTLDTIYNRISVIIDKCLYTLPVLDHSQQYANQIYRVSMAQQQLTIWKNEQLLITDCQLRNKD